MAIVWVDVLPSDDAAAAVRAARLVDDPRVTHLHDADRALARAFGEMLDIDDIAWDVYLLYDGRTAWADPAPVPEAWFHQLGGDRADRAHRRSGLGLVSALHAAATARGWPVGSSTPGADDWDAVRADALARLQEAGDVDGRCSDCVSAGRLSSCSLGQWRRLLASHEGDGLVTVSGHEPASPADGRRVEELQVGGLRCPECMLRAVAGLIAEDQVDEVEVRLDEQRMRIVLAPGATIGFDELAALVEAQGFPGVAPVDA